MTIYDEDSPGSFRRDISKEAVTPRWLVEQREQQRLEDEFYQNWYNEIATICKVIKLEKACGRAIDLFDIYSSQKFTDAETDWLYEQGILRWLYGPISSTPASSGSELCNIIRLYPKLGPKGVGVAA